MKIETSSHLATAIDEACDRYVSDSEAFHSVMDQIKDDPELKDRIMRWGLRTLVAESMAKRGKLTVDPSLLARPDWRVTTG